LTGGGFSIVNNAQFCDHIKLANVSLAAYQLETQMGDPEGEKAAKYLEAYHDNLHDAISLVESSEFVGKIDRSVGFLVRPSALIGLLIFLL
jgi:hypothetical protein